MYDYYEKMYTLISDSKEEYTLCPEKVIRRIIKENIKSLFHRSRNKQKPLEISIDYDAISQNVSSEISSRLSSEILSKMEQITADLYLRGIQNYADRNEIIGRNENIRNKIEAQFAGEHKNVQRRPIMFITDNKYAYPTAVAISSLMFNSEEPDRFDVFVIGDQLDEEMKRLIVSSGINVNVVETRNDFSSIDFEHAHVTKAALNKFYLSEMFPDIDKALYLDSDMIFLRDIAELFETELDGNIVATVPDYHILTSNYMSVINQEGCSNYFNSGMMLMDFKAMRSEGFADKLIKKKIELTKDRRFSFMDQDALNLVFFGRIKYLPVKFNFLNVYYKERSEYEMHQISEESMQDIIDAYDKPYVLHIGGGNKPWNSLLGEKLILYKYYREVNRVYREVYEKNR